MSELSNYIELLLHDEMPKVIKVRIAEMIKEAELHIRPSVGLVTSSPQQLHVQLAPGAQAPSTLAAMARQNQGIAPPPIPLTAQVGPPPPIDQSQIAQTPQAAQALMDRNTALMTGLSGKPVPGEKRPRKW